MRKVLSLFCAATMALTGVAATSVSASALPVAPGASSQTSTSPVVHVQLMRDAQREVRRNDREWRRDRRQARREMRRDRREWRREVRRDRREDRREWRRERREDRRDARRGFWRDNDWAYYNGYRGYHRYRHGYREYNGFWFPAAAFAVGAIIGSTVNSAPPAVIVRPGRLSRAHVEWCYDRYRSYRASDNTFQPYHGPRKPCYSPYD